MQITSTMMTNAGVGAMLRAWRAKRHLSQLALALEAEVSARHLSFIETGRAKPSADLLLQLAERLAVPLRERNALLNAAGFAPRFPETGLSAPGMTTVRDAMQRLLDAHDPYPGVALDRAWNVVLTNAAARRMMAVLPPALATHAQNMFRVSLHPDGFAAFTVNFDEWGSYLLGELQQLCESRPDPDIAALLDEVSGYPNVRALRARNAAAKGRTGVPQPNRDHAVSALLVPCVITLGTTTLSLFTTLATIGAPRDVTLAELTVELFYPSDGATAAALRAHSG